MRIAFACAYMTPSTHTHAQRETRIHINKYALYFRSTGCSLCRLLLIFSLSKRCPCPAAPFGSPRLGSSPGPPPAGQCLINLAYQGNAAQSAERTVLLNFNIRDRDRPSSQAPASQPLLFLQLLLLLLGFCASRWWWRIDNAIYRRSHTLKHRNGWFGGGGGRRYTGSHVAVGLPFGGIKASRQGRQQRSQIS